MASTSSTREAKRAERGTKHIYQKRRMSRALGAVKRKIEDMLELSMAGHADAKSISPGGG